MQTVSWTGAVHLGATFISRFCSEKDRPKAFISYPTWPNHYQIFSQAGFDVQHYPYYSGTAHKIDIKAMILDLKETPSRSKVVLQGCVQNPTGLDPSKEEWRQIADVMAEKGHLSFFDNAYQGFASGGFTQDSWVCRYFVELGFECCIAQSFAKNLGMYGERVGAFHYKINYIFKYKYIYLNTNIYI